MNAPFHIAQASIPGSASAAPPRVIKLAKPQGSQAITVHLDGSTKLDLSDIANEKLTLVRVGDRLVILFDNQSTVSVEPFFDGAGSPFGNISIELAGDRVVTGGEFATLFPVTTDQSVLPAAGEAAGGPTAGANFSDPSVDALGGRSPLDLLGGIDGAGALGTTTDVANSRPVIGTPTAGLVDDEGLSEGLIGGPGDEPGEAVSFTGSLAIDFGVDFPITLSFDAGQPSLAGITSGGQPVSFVITTIGGEPAIVGYTGADPTVEANQVYTITLDAAGNGSYTFTLLQPFDHPITGTEDSIVLSIGFTVQDASGDTASGIIPVTVNDDSSVVGTPAGATIDEDDLPDGNGNDIAVGDDATITDDTIDSDGYATTVSGALAISWGADRFNDVTDGGITGSPVDGDRSVVFASSAIATLAALGLTSDGNALTYAISADGTTLTASQPGNSGPVFTVTLSDTGTGSFTFTLQGNLDHPDETTEDNLSLVFDFTATDSDGDPQSSSFTVVVDDDGPRFGGETPSAPLLDEEGLGGNIGDSYVSGDASGATVSDGGSLGILWGADDTNSNVDGGIGTVGPVDGDRSVTFAASAATSLAALGLTSNGFDLVYLVSDDGTLLTAYRFDGTDYIGGDGLSAGSDPSSAAAVFTMALSDQGFGGYTFTLLDNLDHQTADSEDDITLDFDIVATDSDGDSVSFSVTVIVDDDAPVIGSIGSALVDEDDLGNGNDDARPGDDPTATDGTLDIDTNPRTVAGALGISWGADDANNLGNAGIGSDGTVDGDRAVTFASTAITTLTGLGLTSDGIGLTYTLSANDTVLTATKIGNGEVVFTVSLSDTNAGSYRFELAGNLDHRDGTSEDDLPLTFDFVATDSDGDTQTASFTVTVDDDAPVAGVGTAATVEDEAVNGGNDETDGLSASVTGVSLNIAWGADDANDNTGQPGDRSVMFSNADVAVNGAYGATLTSLGLDVHFTVLSTGELVGYTGDTVPATTAAANVVLFASLSDADNGAYSFTLKQPLDHAAGGGENTLSLTFNFTATDGDGDTSSNTFTVSVVGDQPVIGTPYQSGLVEEEQSQVAGPGNEEWLPTSGDPDWGIPGIFFNDSQTHTTGGTLAIAWGSDNANDNNGQPGDRSVAFDEAGTSVALAGLSSRGDALSYHYSADGTVLTATANDGSGDRTVFTVTLSDVGDGNYTFVLSDVLDHPPTVQGEDTLALNFKFVATDSDGDTTAPATFSVAIVDDAPVAIGTTLDRYVEEEELSGGNEDAQPIGVELGGVLNNGGPITGTIGAPLNIFWGGDDSNVHADGGFTGTQVAGDRSVVFAASDSVAPIEITAAAASAFLTVTGNNGPIALDALTSGGESLVYTLSSNGGVLTATTATSHQTVFTVALSDQGSGSYTFDLMGVLEHPAHGTSASQEDVLSFIFTFTARDGDGDVASDNFTVKVIDDSPVAASNADVWLDDDDVGTGGNPGGTKDHAAPENASGVLAHDYGADGAGTVVLTGASLPGGGFAIASISDTELVISQIQDGSPVDVLRITLTDTTSGAYTVTQLAAIDHAAGNDENNRDFTVKYRVTDHDGDTANGTLDVNVDDDTPVVTANGTVVLDDDDVGTGGNPGGTGDDPAPVAATGTLGHSYGGDGEGTVLLRAGGAPAGFSYALSAGGTVLTITQNSTGTAVLRVTLDDTTSGNYTVEQLAPIVHAAGSDENNQSFTINYRVTDHDGDFVNGSVGISVDDDTPVIGDIVGPTWFTANLDGSTDPADSGFNFGGGYGEVDVFASGSGGFTTKDGTGNYALITQAGPVGDESGPFTRFDDFKTAFLGGFTASVDIYLDTGWTAGSGFDYSVAASRQNGDHLRDFIFHVTKDTSTGQLLVGGSNNTNFDPIENLEAGNHATIATSGWYTFEHVFHDAGDGSLAVDLILRDASGAELWRETRNATADVIATIVGGNRYGWFTNVDVAGGIAVDNVTLTPLGPVGALNEDDLADGTDATKEPVGITGDLAVSWGADNADPDTGTTDRKLVFSASTLATLTGLGLESDDVALVYQVTTNADGNQTLTAYKGTAASGNEVFTVVLDDDGTGSYTFTLIGNIDHPAGSGQNDRQLSFGFDAVDADGDVASSSFTVNIHDDVPVAGVVTAATVLDDDEQTLFAGNAGGTGDVDNATSVSGVAGTLFTAGADGLQSLVFAPPANLQAIRVDAGGHGVPEALIYQTTDDGAGHTILTATGAISGDTVFVLTVGDDGNYTFVASRPLVHSAAGTTEETTAVTIGFTATDGDGDQAAGTLTIQVNDDTPVVTGDGTHNAGPNENDIDAIVGIQPAGTDGTQPSTVTGTISKVAFGADGFGSLAFTGAFAVPNENSGALAAGGAGLDSGMTSDGRPVYFRLSADGLTIEGYVPAAANGGIEEVVLRAVLDGVDRDYSVTLLGNIDHQPPNTTDNRDDAQSMQFTVRGTDGDGDYADVALSVRIADDAPTASFSGRLTLQEDRDSSSGDFVVTSASGTIVFNGGADGAKVTSIAYGLGNATSGYLAADGDAASYTAHPLTSNGQAVVMETSPDGLTLTAKTVGGDTVFVVQVTNASTGAYTFTQYGPIDHFDANESGSADPARLKIVFTVTDGDGDTATNSLQIDIRDDAPVVGSAEDGSVQEISVAVPLANASFEAQSLVSGQPGVITDVKGNYAYGSPSGWTITGGNGGLFAPAASIVDADGHAGGNVVWLRNGAMLSQDTGEIIGEGEIYTVRLNVADRTDQGWPGGEVRLVATDGVNTVVLAQLALPTPPNGDWTAVELNSPAVTAAQALALSGYHVRVEVQQTAPGSGNQILVDNVELSTMPATSDTDSLGIDWGADNSAALRKVAFAASLADDDQVTTTDGPLTSNDKAVRLVRVSDTELLGVADDDSDGFVDDGGRIVFRVTLDDGANPADQGSWHFTLLDNVDHVPAANDAALGIAFAFVATDADGDATAASSFVVEILDSTAVLTGPVTTGLSIDEDDLPAGNDASKETLSVTGNLAIDLGADDGGSIALSAANATWDAGTRTLSADDGSWKIVLNGDGTYTFTLLDNTLAHGPADNGENPFSITVNYAVTDGDADVVPGAFEVAIVDDVPVAVVDTASLPEDGSFSGNVLTNDNQGADGATLTKISFEGPSPSYGSFVPITAGTDAGGGDYEFVRPEGTYLFNADGSYTFTPDANYNGPAGFAYIITDADGDESDPPLTFNVQITVTPVDDAPDFGVADDHVSYVEPANANMSNLTDAYKAFAGSSFTLTDVDGTTEYQSVTLTATGGDKLFIRQSDQGGLTLNNGSIVITQSQLATGTLIITKAGGGNLTQAEVLAALQKVIFHTDEQTATPESHPVQIVVRDDTGLDSAPVMMTVDVTGTNDAPYWNNASLTTTTAEDVGFALHQKFIDTQITPNDRDGEGPVQLTLTAANGVLTIDATIAGALGVAIVGGASGTATVTLEGSLAAIEDFLINPSTTASGVTFTPTENYFGAATVTMLVSDLGDQGLGTQTAASVININVTPVNDAPVLQGTDSVAIVNPGFEANATYGSSGSEGRWSNGSPTGWTVTGPSHGGWFDPGPAGPAGADGVLPMEADNGTNVLWLNDGQVASQTLAATAQMGTYELSVEVGDRRDVNLTGMPDFAVRLYAGATLVAETVVPQQFADGPAWTTLTLTASFPAGSSLIGQPLRIAFANLEVPGSGGDFPQTVQVNLDNVSLTHDGSRVPLVGIDEDAVGNPGQTVASILGDYVTDVDPGAVEGIAVFAADDGNGTWQYFDALTSTWTDFGAVSQTGALLLRADDVVRFLPNEENGTTATFDYVAWDQTSGSRYANADVTARGGSTAFSIEEGQASIVVTSVNDAPVITGGATAGSVTESGDILGIDEAGLGGALEPTFAVATTMSVLLTDPSQLTTVLAAVQAELGGSLPQAIAVVWDYLDDIYTSAGPNQVNVNESFVRLGIEYADYVQDGGSPLVDVVAKFLPDDGTDADATPERLQSLHDNLLGNLQTGALNQRFGAGSDKNLELQALIAAVDPDLLTRIYYEGYDHQTSAYTQARTWDVDNGFVPMATGTLTAADVDTGDSLNWSITGPTTYGAMSIDAATGKWTYKLDNADADTQALAEGQTVFQTYTATVTDVHGATDTQSVTITITGTNDAPMITGGVATATVFESGDIDNVVEANVALDSKFEPLADLDSLIQTEINAHPNSMATVLADVRTAMGPQANLADAIAMVWDNLDDHYTATDYYNTSVNEQFIRLGVEYAKYLAGGGRPLTDVIAKFTADSGDLGSDPDRLQSMHDNLLGNFNNSDFVSRFGSNPTLYNELLDLIATTGLPLTDRPVYSGNEGAANNAFTWDIAHGLISAASGQLDADDVDTGASMTWSGNAIGTYGSFAIDATTGQWTYTLDDSDGDTQALAEGQTVTDSFVATVSDGLGGVDTQTVTITVKGSNDAPTDIGLDNLAIASGNPGFVANLAVTDVDGNAFTFQVTNPNGTVNSAFAVTGTPGNYDLVLTGPITSLPPTLTITATDAFGASHSETFALTLPVQLFAQDGNLLGSFTTIQEAVYAAHDGQHEYIVAPAGTYAENITVDRGVEIRGANYGIDGADTDRDPETIIQGQITVTETSNTVTIDGVYVENNSAEGVGFNGVRVNGGAAVTVQNNVFWSTQDNGFSGGAGEDKAVFLTAGATGAIVIHGNSIGGTAGSGGISDLFGNAAWARGIWSDGNSSSLTITGNTLQNVRSGLNLDFYDDATSDVSGNTFLSAGSAISVGGTAPTGLTSITGNTFGTGNPAETPIDQVVFTEFNLQNLTTGLNLDLSQAPLNTAPDGAFVIEGTQGGDTIIGSAGTDFIFADGGASATSPANGSDTVTGGGGDDLIIGGRTRNGTPNVDDDTHQDTATYAGDLSVATITALSGTDYTDALVATFGPAGIAGGTRGGITSGWRIDNSANGDGVDIVSDVAILDDGVGGRILLVGNGGFETIQAAVNAAQDGDTILIATGTYQEQVVVDGIDNLTIRTAVGADVDIVAPADVHPTETSSSGRATNAIVTVTNATNVQLVGLDIDGLGNGNTVDGANANFVGVFYRNASGGLDGVDISGIHDAYPGGTTIGGHPIQSGSQRGVGLQVDNDASGPRLAFFMDGGSITDFQKNATVFSHAALDIDNVVITGGGAQPIIAQNGIQVMDSTGDITGVVITGIGYAGPSGVYSGGMLLYDNVDLDVIGNAVTGANGESTAAKVFGIYVLNNGGAIDGGSVTGNTISQVDYGIIVAGNVTPDQVVLDGNTITDLDGTNNYPLGVYHTPNATLTTPFDVEGSAQADYLRGAAAADTLAGLGGDDTLEGRGGNDTILAGAGDDTIVYTVGDGADVLVDGGTDDDTLQINGDGNTNAFAVTNTDGDPSSLEVTVDGQTSIVTNVEDIVIDGSGGADTLTIAGDLTGTGLAFSTITFDGGADNDTVDASALTSAHGVVFTGGGGDDTFKSGAGNDVFHGDGGSDTAVYASSYADSIVTWNGTTATVFNGVEGTDSVDGAGKLEFAGGTTVWLVGAGSEYTTLTQLFDGNPANGEVNANDVVYLAPGSYSANINIALSGIEIRGAGDGTNPSTDTILTFTSGNAINFSAGAGDFTLRDLRVSGTGSGNGLHLQTDFDGLTVDNVTFHDMSIGIRKPTSATLADVTITNTEFAENNYGIYFANDGNSHGVIATDVTLTGVTFTNNLHAAMYAETLQDATFTDITATGNSTGSANGIVFDFWTAYAGTGFSNIAFKNVDIDNGGGAAVYSAGFRINAFEDAAGTPTDISFEDVSVDNALRGIRTNADESELSFSGTISLDGTTYPFRYEGIDGADDFDAGSLPTLGSADYILLGDFYNHFLGNSYEVGADDRLAGSGGDDQIFGNLGDDTLRGRGGNDAIDGGVGTDTALYDAPLTAGNIDVNGSGGWTVTTGGAEGTDTLTSTEIVDGTGTGKFLLVGNGGFDTIQAAVDAAQAGDTILIAAGTWTGAGNTNVLIDKPLTIVGRGDGDAAADTIISGGGFIVDLDDDAEAGTVAFQNLAIIDATGAGISAQDHEVLGTLSLDHIRIEDADYHGLIASGRKASAAYDQAGVQNVVITNSTFVDNAQSNSNSANIMLFEFDGNATITDVTASNSVTGTSDSAAFGIQIAGFDGPLYDQKTPAPGSSLGSYDVLTPMGAVTIDGLDISGYSRKASFYIQGYTNTNGLSITDSTVDAVSTSWGKPVVVDPMADQLPSGTPNNATNPGSFFDETGANGSYNLSGLTVVQHGTQVSELDGTTKAETIIGTNVTDVITGFGGNDTLEGRDGDDFVFGGDGQDILRGGYGQDSLYGGNDNDRIGGKQGNDTIYGETGNDQLWGDENDDAITGGTGNDEIYGGTGNDSIHYAVGDGSDTVDGGSGSDTLHISGDGNANVFAVQNLVAPATSLEVGVDGQTSIVKGVEDIVITGGGGDDSLTVAGNLNGTGLAMSTITFDGGADDDTVNASGLTSAHHVAFTGGAGTDTFVAHVGCTLAIVAGHWVVTDGVTGQVLTGVEKVIVGATTYLLVDQFGTDTGGFQSVQAAIDHASGGETILIAPGTYTETSLYVPGDYQGLYIDKPNLTLQGVKADGSLITTSADAQTYGATIIAGAQNMFGANHWIDTGGDGTTITGLHLQAGAETDNKLLEIWADDVTVTGNFIDVYVGGTTYSWAAAIYINDNGTTASDEVTRYDIDGNILNEGVILSNGIGDPVGDVSADQRITDNTFVGSFDETTGEGRYDTLVINGNVPGVGWLLESVQLPTVSGNTIADNSVPILFRVWDETPANLPTAGEVATIVDGLTDATDTYAYVLDGAGDPDTFERVSLNGVDTSPFFVVTNSISTLNLGQDATGDNVFGGKRIDMNAGDTIVVQTVGTTDETIAVDGLNVMATASSTDLDLTLGTELPDHTAATVQSVTLLDYATGQGADVDVTGNDLANTVIGNSGSNTLAGGGGFDTLTGGAGYDVLAGGESLETYTAATGEGDKAVYANVIAAGDITPVGTTGWSVNGHAEGNDTLDGIEIVQGADPAGGPTGRFLLVGNGGFATIQAAIDEAVDGDTIMIAAGTYEEMLSIVGKDITLIGQGDSTIITPPDGEIPANTTVGASAKSAIVAVNDAMVTIQDVQIDGDGRGNERAAGSGDYDGIVMLNSGGTIDGVTITGIRGLLDGDGHVSGGQWGVGVYVKNTDDQPRHLLFTANTIEDFQKNATAFFGNGLDVTVTGNVITGNDGTSTTAQNGLQFSDGVTGTASSNTITEIGYFWPGSGDQWTSSGILSYGADVDITGNTVSGPTNAPVSPQEMMSTGIYVYGDPDGSILQSNTVSDFTWGIISWGDGDQPTIADNAFSDDAVNLVFYDPAVAVNVTGSSGVDEFDGGSGNDTFDGLGAGDVIAGDLGNDTLSGGSGADTFVFAETGAGNVDTISDYSFADGDTIDLSALLDAAFDTGENAAGFVRAVSSGGNALIQVDIDGVGGNWEDVAVLQGYGDTGNTILVQIEENAAAQQIHPV